MHASAAIFVSLCALGQAWTAPRYEDMDYGPFLSATYQSNGAADQVTEKGIAVKLEYPHKSDVPEEGPIGGGLYSALPPEDITGTEEQSVYKTQRWKFGGYRLNVPPGSYTVTLKFSDSWSNKEQRVFDVLLQGEKVVDKLDIVDRVGKGAALDLKFDDVKVIQSEQLLIEFIRHSGEPSISGIVIEGDGYERRINCGGPATKQYNADWKPGQSARTSNLAGIIFDTDLLRYSVGWTDGYLHLKGVVFDGAHGVNPGPAGNQVLVTTPGPGWSRSDDLDDPRAIPHGPLPKDCAHYQGLYRHRSATVFSYTVGETAILDMPGAEELEGQRILTRTLRLGPSTETLTCVIEDWPEGAAAQLEDGRAASLSKDGRARVVALSGAARGATLELSGEHRVVLKIEPHEKPVRYKLGFAVGSLASSTELALRLKSLAVPSDLTALVKGAPALWEQAVITKGKRAADDAAYVSDSIGLPDENPWHSWIRPTALDFLSDGRLVISTWSGDVWMVSGVDETLKKITWKRFASGLFQPLGLRVVADQIYVLGRDQITRLHDFNADGEADFYENFNNDCFVTANFHEFAVDLQTDAAGNFYYLKSGPLRPGGRGWDKITPHHGALLKVSKDGSQLEVVATGLRSPNGMAIGPRGQITTSDNEGAWTPTTPINLIRPGGFYGVPELSGREVKPTARELPLCWIPHSVDNSGASQVWITGNRFGPLSGDLLHLSYGQCQLFCVLMQTVSDKVQGSVIPLPLKFDTGIMRARFREKDNALYLTGLRGWQSTATREAGLYRVRYTGKSFCTPVATTVYREHIAITFSEPLDRSHAEDTDNYTAECWNYRWSEQYGSKNYRPSAPDEEGEDELDISSAQLSPDGKTVYLQLKGLQPVMQLQLGIDIQAADETPVKQDIYSTLHTLGEPIPPALLNAPVSSAASETTATSG
jgi:glucose/arabinose dehydrogenase